VAANDDFAQGGGTDASKIEDALSTIEQVISGK